MLTSSIELLYECLVHVHNLRQELSRNEIPVTLCHSLEEVEERLDLVEDLVSCEPQDDFPNQLLLQLRTEVESIRKRADCKRYTKRSDMNTYTEVSKSLEQLQGLVGELQAAQDSPVNGVAVKESHQFAWGRLKSVLGITSDGEIIPLLKFVGGSIVICIVIYLCFVVCLCCFYLDKYEAFMLLC